MSTRQAITAAIQRQASLTAEQAEAVFAEYKRAKVLRISVRGLELTHGGFLDKDVILRALAQAKVAS